MQSDSNSAVSSLQLNPREQLYYSELFAAADSGKLGYLTGQAAVAFMSRSNLRQQQLAEIWQLADTDGRGVLDRTAFFRAMKLIAAAQSGWNISAQSLYAQDLPLPHITGFSQSPILAQASQRNELQSNAAPLGPTEADKQKFIALFNQANPVNGILPGDKLKDILLRSRLPNEQLGQIWNLADVRRSGSFNQDEFIIAMYFVQGLMDGTIKTLPATLPASLHNSSANSSFPQYGQPNLQASKQNVDDNLPLGTLARQLTGSPQTFQNVPPLSPITRHLTGSPTLSRASPSRSATLTSLGASAFNFAPQWDISTEEKRKFDQFFDNIDSDMQGRVEGSDAVDFFSRSGLPSDDLARIWDLADIRHQGSLSRDEFAVAMYLIQRRMGGHDIPRELPRSLVPPSMREGRPNMQVNSPKQQAPIDPFSEAPAMQSYPQGWISPQTTGMTASSIGASKAAPQNSEDMDLLGDFDADTSLKYTEETKNVNALHTELLKIGNDLPQVTQKRQTLEAQLASIKDQYAKLEKALTQQKSMQQSEESALESLKARRDAEQPGVSDLSNEYEAAEKAVQEVRQQKDALEAQIQASKAEANECRAKVRQIQEEANKLRAQLEALRKEGKVAKLDLETEAAIKAAEAHARSGERTQVSSSASLFGDQTEDKFKASSEATGSPVRPVPSASQSGNQYGQQKATMSGATAAADLNDPFAIFTDSFDDTNSKFRSQGPVRSEDAFNSAFPSFD
ncbi:hypothetical protein BZG36_02926 [Bifiguratus adelaidae]|uniref:Endocytosis protein 3 n=1 Tax=Bifiguratus adelaidae TaxID=1938954 RepID=A0A261Y003_9FUNG|nr:hypothetical protein BZG36_02926 [Bifiguratus adelaidae]